jgi:hypothetical protein
MYLTNIVKNIKDSHNDAEIEKNNLCSSNERLLIDSTFIDYKKNILIIIRHGGMLM